MQNDALSTIIAYQTSSRYRLQQAYDVLDVDVNAYLSQEQQIADEIETLAQKLHQFTATGQLAQNTPNMPIPTSQHVLPHSKTYPRINMLPLERLDEFAASAKQALEKHGIDPERDPLLQVLDAQQVWDITASYRKKYGDVEWGKADYVVVTLAGALGAILELLLVKLPGHSELLLTLPQGYAMTSWLTTSVKRLETEVPDTLNALLHDPVESPSGNWLWRFVTVLLDLVRHSGTSVNEHGNIVTAQRLVPETERAYTTSLLHIVFQAFGTVFNTVDIDDPFADLHVSLADSGDAWDAVTAYAQTHGFRPRLFLREGVIPAAIELFVQGYWVLRHFPDQEALTPGRLKLTSMLALSHTLAISGYFVKSGLLFHLDPLALN